MELSKYIFIFAGLLSLNVGVAGTVDEEFQRMCSMETKILEEDFRQLPEVKKDLRTADDLVEMMMNLSLIRSKTQTLLNFAFTVNNDHSYELARFTSPDKDIEFGQKQVDFIKSIDLQNDDFSIDSVEKVQGGEIILRVKGKIKKANGRTIEAIQRVRLSSFSDGGSLVMTYEEFESYKGVHKYDSKPFLAPFENNGEIGSKDIDEMSVQHLEIVQKYLVEKAKYFKKKSSPICEQFQEDQLAAQVEIVDRARGADDGTKQPENPIASNVFGGGSSFDSN